MASSAQYNISQSNDNTRGAELRTNSSDIDAWLRRSGLGLRSVLNAWSRRTTGMSFARLVEANPRLAATLAYQVLGDSLGGYIANLILEHSREHRDSEDPGGEESLGGSIGGRGDALSLSLFP